MLSPRYDICVRVQSRDCSSRIRPVNMYECVYVFVCAREYGRKGPAVLLEFDGKKAEISTLSRFAKLWRVACRGADPHTRIVNFGGHGRRVAVVSEPQRKKGNVGVGTVATSAKGATKMSPNTNTPRHQLGTCYTLGSRECDAQGYVNRKRKREDKYETYVSCKAAVEAAGGVHCISFASTPKQVERIVGDAQHFVITPIQQIWPVNTEKQLRCLVYELVRRDEKLQLRKHAATSTRRRR